MNNKQPMTIPAIDPGDSDEDGMVKTLLQSTAAQHELDEFLEMFWQ